MTLGIALGVSLYVATTATSDSLVISFEKMAKQISGRAQATIRGRGGSLSGDLTPDVLHTKGVAHASGMVEITLRDPKLSSPLLILGVDFLGDPYFLPFNVESGDQAGGHVVDDPLAFVNDPYAILISRSLAKRRNLHVGDTIRLTSAQGPTNFDIRGILEDSGPAAAFGGQVAVMALDAAQVAFNRGHDLDRIEVAFKPNASHDAVLARLRKVVGNRGVIELPEARRQRVVRLLDPIRGVLWLSGMLSLIVAMFLIYNAVGVAVAQRRREIGITRALGATRTSVVASFCGEAVALGLPGAIAGVFIGRFLAQLALHQMVPSISQLYLPLQPPPPTIRPELALKAIGLGLLLTLLAALLPAARAARVDPALCMRGRTSAATEKLPQRTMALFGILIAAAAWASTRIHSPSVGLAAATAALIAAALLAPAFLTGIRTALVRPRIPLGPSTKLGLTNVQRDLRRSAVNAIALTGAVSLSITAAVWRESIQGAVTSWFEQGSVQGDMVVSAGSPLDDQYHVPFGAEILSKVRSTPGVEAVVPYRTLQQDPGNGGVSIVAFDTRPYSKLLAERGKSWDVVDGRKPIGQDELAAHPEVILSDSAAARFHKHAGDTIQLDTPNGPTSFEVRAIIGKYFLDQPAVLMDRKYFADRFGDDRIDYVDVFVGKSADAAKVSAALRKRLGAGEGMFVTRAGELRKHITKTVEDTFKYASSMEFVALLIALLGVTGTMLAVVTDRTRELGMLRAIGASKVQVAIAITAEAATLGIGAALLGTLCGALQGKLVLESIGVPGSQWNLGYVFPVIEAIRVGALVVATAAIAGVVPAYRAARLDVKQALTYE